VSSHLALSVRIAIQYLRPSTHPTMYVAPLEERKGAHFMLFRKSTKTWSKGSIRIKP
jgi:hypothetical protein